MGVGSRPAKRANACDTRPLRRLPGHGFARDEDLMILLANMRVELLHIQMSRDLLMMERQNCFNQPGNTCRSGKVPDIRLHRAYDKRIISRTIFIKHTYQCAYFDRIAERCARTMRFNVAYLLWFYIGDA